MESVESSHIDAIGYDDLKEELVVKFKNGQEYTYSDVKPFVYNDFLNSESKGKFFAQNIKGVYPERR